MTIRLLEELLGYCAVKKVRGAQQIPITGICYDSRKAAPGFLFIANSGLHVDGHRFIPAALVQGAAAVVHSCELADYAPGVTYLLVEDTRRAQAELCAAFYSFPAEKLRIIGVTGTDGKSSTVWFIQQLLEKSDRASGFISTVSYQTAAHPAPNPYRQSTPEALEIHMLLAEMVRQGKEYVVMETTSHGLSLQTGRLRGIEFAAGLFLNISHEHLEFHGTFEQYRHDKANLFRQLKCTRPQPGCGVVNRDDPHHGYFAAVAAGAPVYSYSLQDPAAELFAVITGADIQGSDLLLHYEGSSYQARLNIPGSFNVENLLGALLTVCKLLPTGLKALLPLIPQLSAPTGRVCSVQEGQPFHVLVDYAHTPKSFERLFALLRPLACKKLIAVFGSGGERDIIKRPIQGEIAARFCDIVIVTDEDPRGEDRGKILEEIAAGCHGKVRGKDLLLIPDRSQAIAHAFSLAQAEDTVLLLGKGHESSIIYPDGPLPWNEIEVCRRLLRAKKSDP